MDIMGSVNISLDMPDAAILHNFRVLNSKTYRNVLLGRDFLAKFDRIEFDFAKNRVRIGKHWFPCRDVSSKDVCCHEVVKAPDDVMGRWGWAASV